MATDAIRFRFDDSQAQRALEQLGPRAPAVIARVLNRTSTSVRAVMARNVAADIGLRVGDVREQILVRPALAQSEDRLVARLTISGSRIPLAKFVSAAQLKSRLPSRGRGTISARIGKSRKQYPGKFLAQMDSGYIGVFERKAGSRKKSRGAWGPNLPIQEKFGPSLPHVFAKHIPAGIARGEEQLAKNLEHELGFALSQVTA